MYDNYISFFLIQHFNTISGLHISNQKANILDISSSADTLQIIKNNFDFSLSSNKLPYLGINPTNVYNSHFQTNQPILIRHKQDLLAD